MSINTVKKNVVEFQLFGINVGMEFKSEADASNYIYQSRLRDKKNKRTTAKK